MAPLAASARLIVVDRFFSSVAADRHHCLSVGLFFRFGLTLSLSLADKDEGQCHRSAHVMTPNHPTA